MHLVHGSFALLATAWLLSSCAVPGVLWKDTPWQGPLIAGNQSANLQERCDLTQVFMSDSTRCDRAFIDHNGRRVDVTVDVRDVIDDYLDHVPELAPYIGQRRTDFKSGESPWQSPRKGSPFRVYILTISPIIVLAVPRANFQEDYDELYCTANIFARGCLPTSRLSLCPYWYKGAPRVRAGSFWFSPALPGSSIAVPEGLSEYAIKVGSDQVLLRNDGTHWTVTRDHSSGSAR